MYRANISGDATSTRTIGLHLDPTSEQANSLIEHQAFIIFRHIHIVSDI